MACSDRMTAAITSDGALFTWGDGTPENLGYVQPARQFVPRQVGGGLAGQHVMQVLLLLWSLCKHRDSYVVMPVQLKVREQNHPDTGHMPIARLLFLCSPHPGTHTARMTPSAEYMHMDTLQDALDMLAPAGVVRAFPCSSHHGRRGPVHMGQRFVREAGTPWRLLFASRGAKAGRSAGQSPGKTILGLDLR